MPSYLFSGGQFLNPRLDELTTGVEVLVEDDRIKQVSTDPIQAPNATRIDLGGRTLMPGLIDAHVHVFLPEVNFSLLETQPLTLLAIKASALMRKMLMRGFTTIRDVGGADLGMKLASEAGLIDAPRLFIAGMAITQTGGQADVRRKNQSDFPNPNESALHYWSRVADGVPAMLKAVRDELRKGADHIKLMASGGVLSLTGSMRSPQFSKDEIRAACEEAHNWGSYVCAHAYSGEAIQRAVQSGVRTIEHGNLLDEQAANLMAERGAFLIPTLSIFDALGRRGGDYGLPEISRRKNEEVLEAGFRSLEMAKRAGVEMGYGTDLVGELQDEQAREFILRNEVLSPIDIIRSATLVNARILQRERVLGEIIPGALADLLVVDGNPLQEINLLQNQGEHLSAIMKGGQFYKNFLATLSKT